MKESLHPAGLLDVAGIATRCNVSKRTVANWTRQRRIPFLKIGKSIRFSWLKVEAALNRFEIKEIR